MLSTVMYIWACLCTQLYSDYYAMGITTNDYFGRLDYTLFSKFVNGCFNFAHQILICFTLLEHSVVSISVSVSFHLVSRCLTTVEYFVSTLENWADIVREVDLESRVAWPVFVVFVVITSFILYSLVIAVICGAVANVSDDDEEKLSDAEAQELILQYHRKIELLKLEQRQFQSLCQACIMCAEKRNKDQARPAIQSSPWFSWSFLYRTSENDKSLMSQPKRRTIPHLDDSNVVSSFSSERGCLATPPGVQELRKFCGTVVNEPRVQICIIVMIAINALMMGIATYDFVTDSREATLAFDTIDQCFLIIFTVEIGLQVIYHGIWRVLTDGWLCFDFFVIVGSWSLSNIQIIRSFRILRALRLATRLDVLKRLVQALINVAPSVGGIISLFVLILYAFSVLCTNLFGELFSEGVVNEDYFGRLDRTFFSK
jgi:Ion transport protein